MYKHRGKLYAQGQAHPLELLRDENMPVKLYAKKHSWRMSVKTNFYVPNRVSHIP